jgi:hypothetical protein
MLPIGMEAGIEQRRALRMLDPVDRDRHGNVALAALHQTGELAGERAASEGVELDRHNSTRMNRGHRGGTLPQNAATADQGPGAGFAAEITWGDPIEAKLLWRGRSA